MLSSNYQQNQLQLSKHINQIYLLDLYQKTEQKINRIQILSRLKKILLMIPNNFQADINYVKFCNDRYFLFINLHINQMKQKAIQMKFLYHIISLRIKLWFNKKQFDDVFSSFLLNIQHNRRIIPYVVQFLIELIDTFQSSNEKQYLFDQYQMKKNKRQTQIYQNRLTLTRKTNSHFFSENRIRQQQWKINSQIHSGYKKKNLFTKQNRFQRQFLDFQLNKLLSFANQVFNRSIQQNPNYNYEDQSSQKSSQAQQQQPVFLIQTPLHNIARTLQLLHKILTYDFFNQKSQNQIQEYYYQKSPLIIPTKYSKYCKYTQFEKFIKNKTNIMKYQFLYFDQSPKQIKINIIKIFGDMLRIHQKYFKKQNIYKTHIQMILQPLKNMTQSYQIQNQNQLKIAIILGQNLNKILSNQIFPFFINQFKLDYKQLFIESIAQSVLKEILHKKILDVNLIRIYLGFFIQFDEKISINLSANNKKSDMKDQVETILNKLGSVYQEQLYKKHINTQTQNQLNIITLNSVVKDLRFQQFQTFFQIFKVYSPKKTYKQTFNIHEKCIFICAKLQYNINLYEYLQKIQMKQQINTTKYQLSRRHARQSLYKLIDILKQKQQQNKEMNYSLIIQILSYKLIMIMFFLNKIKNSINEIILIFEQDDDTIFKFTKEVIQIIYNLEAQLNEENQKFDFQQKENLQNLAIFSHTILEMTVQLNQNYLNTKIKDKQSANDVQQTLNRPSNRKSFGRVPVQLDQQSGKADLQLECQMVQNQLKYYEKIIGKIHYFSKISSQTLQKVINEQQLKGIYFALKNNKLQQMIEPLYNMYFIALNKCQTHKKVHQKLLNRKVKIRKSFYEYVNNEDQCQVIQEDLQCNQQNYKYYLKCTKNINNHNLIQKMNSIAFYVYLNYLNSNSRLKTEVEQNFKIWIQKVQSNNIKFQSQEMKSYFDLYRFQQIIKFLNNMINDQNKTQFHLYSFKCSNIFINMFRSPKYNNFTKQQFLNCFLKFNLKQFQQSKNKINEMISKNNSNLNINQDQYYQISNEIALKLQGIINILQLLININFHQCKINIFNQQFLILLDSLQLQGDKQSIHCLQIEQQNQIKRKLKYSMNIKSLFNQILIFFIDFPNQLITNSYSSLIQPALIKLTKQIYFQLSHFINIYIFSTQEWYNQQEQRNDYKIFNYISNPTQYQRQIKYMICFNQHNSIKVKYAFVMLIKYISKIFQLSIISKFQQWNLVRNKDILPFIQQIIDFIQKFIKCKQLNVKYIQSQESQDQESFVNVLIKFLNNIQMFFISFLQNLEQYQISFIIKNLPLLTLINEFIELVKKLEIQKITNKICLFQFKLNEITVYKFIVNKNSSKQKKSTILENVQQIKQYKGWDYIKRISELDHEIIFEQLETYMYKHKYYIKYQQQNNKNSDQQQVDLDSQELNKTQYLDNYLQTKKKTASKSKSVHKKSINEKSYKINNKPDIQWSQVCDYQMGQQQSQQQNKSQAIQQKSKRKLNQNEQNLEFMFHTNYTENQANYIQNQQSELIQSEIKLFNSNQNLELTQEHTYKQQLIQEQMNNKKVFEDDQLTVFDNLQHQENHKQRMMQVQIQNEIKLPIIQQQGSISFSQKKKIINCENDQII